MGRPKQLLELEGKPILQHTLDIVAERFEDAVLVLGHEADAIQDALEISSRVRVVRNPDHLSGQASSVKVGIAAVAAESEAAAVFLGDQPGISGSLIDEVIAAFRGSTESVVRPGSRDAPGHPVLVRRESFEQWARLTGDEGARSLMRGPDVHFVATSSPLPDDVDTPEDYERIRRG
ncbi:MAG: nucleotidyltransferase family protein [Actinomycetota bacterium]|nr:nucleotidyltransferase family protein [Actinomycetota bacterium]